MPRKRSATTFNLSFLDVMSCGFGAVVLVYLIIDHSVEVQTRAINSDLMSEVNMLEEDVRDGEEGLVRLRNILSDVDYQMVEAQGRATRISDEIETYQALIETLRRDGFTENSDIESLKAEIQALEEEVKKLRASSEDTGGLNARSFTGDGNRQYLTGLNLGGDNILILLDRSASMLAPKLVNIIRMRNMDESVRREADKWQRALETVEWLTAQMPINSKYQIYAFNTEAQPVLAGTEGSWLEVADDARLEESITAMRALVPTGGTSMENAFRAALALKPRPDNVFLLTDGLPTQGSKPPRGNTISGRQRMDLFQGAVRLWPGSIPINIILAPMEGDPRAASAFWQLAQATAGSFLSPAEDWP
jgi:hypothetical protein